MTETTDIAALWRQSHSLRTPDQTDAFIDKVLNLLEAERQRADAMQSERDEFRRRLKLERSILEDLEKRLRYTEESLIAANDLLIAAEARVKELEVPDGWQLAPRHVDTNMAEAGKMIDARLNVWKCQDIYQAMLAAAPKYKGHRNDN